MTLEEAGVAPESNIQAFLDLEGGKRKRKKKVYTKPKKIKHKHKARKLALLDYYTVEDGKVKKLKSECSVCEVATYMADHPDRMVCGKCGKTHFRLTATGERLPIPKQNKPAVAVAAAAPTKAAPAKKKKK